MKKLLLLGTLSLFTFTIGQPSPATATILFASGEDTGFTLNGSAAGSTFTGWRSNFARAAVNITNSATVADPPANRATTPTFTATSNLWLHAQVNSSGNTTTANQQTILVRSPDGVSRIVVRETGTAGQLKISTRNAAGTLTDLATASSTFASGGPIPIDLYVNYTCSGSGGVQLYLSGAQVINYTGNPCTDSATQLNQADIAGTNTSSGYWSEIIIADEDTRGMSLWTLYPVAAGNTQAWTPSTVGNINKGVINDATSIGTSSNNALTEWTTPTSAPNGAWNVKAVVQEARTLVGTSGPLHFEWLIRTIDGSDNVTGSVAPTTSFASYSNQIWATNPHTSSAWSLSDIASGFNLGIESLP
ncbi:hypothetical protein NLM31_12875 [Bradyrhizobium sp. CCGUVB4N]|uniref:hypothetical protein n=1 Tax=Bradyrhizobium sp. CCGUVB4N TaxID=2949631 RepID=UPI0020B20E81|nr:hypothetical protein [Bradyrhizobium sp. CCGUVB4N]MCP3381234.1 hypothetical protein [Bradyrhizobium sp. CCGUVB4N]